MRLVTHYATLYRAKCVATLSTSTCSVPVWEVCQWLGTSNAACGAPDEAVDEAPSDSAWTRARRQLLRVPAEDLAAARQAGADRPGCSAYLYYALLVSMHHIGQGLFVDACNGRGKPVAISPCQLAAFGEFVSSGVFPSHSCHGSFCPFMCSILLLHLHGCLISGLRAWLGGRRMRLCTVRCGSWPWTMCWR